MAGSFGDLRILTAVSEPVLDAAPPMEHFLAPTNLALEDVLRFLDAREPRLRFGRMFPDVDEFRPPADALIKLGQAMGVPATIDDHPSLSAGYTYLGQFIDHDVTFDLTTSPPIANVPVNQIKQGRTPSLDLDSLYGAGPAEEKPGGPKRYADDGVRLVVGTTKRDFALHESRNFPNDLPRKGDPKNDSAAAIEDPRNDENLVVAQTTLAFIKFHNAVVSSLEKDYAGEELFNEARQKVIRHYQWIVLHDFLPALIGRDVLKVVREDGCKHFLPEAGEEPFMPLEFSRAAFRIGHSQVRDEYEWNHFFQSPSHGGFFKPTLSHLLDFTGFRGGNIGGNDRLPSSWIIDWSKFFDFAEFPGVKPNPPLNFTKKIDTSIARQFTNLPVPPTWPTEMRSLAVIDLLRGGEVGLPAAQTVVERLKQKASQPDTIRRLTRDEIAQKHPEVVKHHGFDEMTPLWYYILREAEVLSNGTLLGPVGGYILAETFVGLIKASPISILKREHPDDAEWQPDLGRIQEGRFNMADLLYFVNDLNPLATH